MIEDFGWGDALQAQFTPYAAEGLVPGRITAQHRDHYQIITPQGEAGAHLSGRFVHGAGDDTFPVTGDWVAVALHEGGRAATVHHVLARRTSFVRKAAFAQVPQVVAANVDAVLIVAALGGDINLRRLERTLAIAWEGGATPAIILTKADLCADAAAQARAVAGIAGGVTVLVTGVKTGLGIAALRALIPPRTTAVLLGSSGAGKSTLVNALFGEELMATQSVRESDGRGRHTTSHRELLLLPGGGCILDTPGMRELGLWEAEAGIAATFADVEALAGQCRFGDCKHASEPGCAIRQALADGVLDEARWQGYLKLGGELATLKKNDRQPAPAARKKPAGKRVRRRPGEEEGEE